MLYNNQTELLNILKTENLYTKKNLGQNFLFNTKVIEKIISASEISPNDNIIEVGPGLGILTNELIKISKQVITIEKDSTLIPYLNKTFHSAKNLKIIHQDILKYPIKLKNYKVVANIPYYITSPIITHFLHSQYQPKTLILLTQLEVAEKILAKKGDHNILSLQTQAFADCQIIDKVSPNNFIPAPKVYSAILKLQSLNKPKIKDWHNFTILIKKAFSQKRKTLENSLSTLWGHNKTEWSSILQEAKIPPNSRPQHLDFSDWDKILQVAKKY